MCKTYSASIKAEGLDSGFIQCGQNHERRMCQFAGPCAQGVLDPLIVPRPMSLGRPGLFVLIKDYAFLRASAHESVPLAGYLLDTCWLLAVSR